MASNSNQSINQSVVIVPYPAFCLLSLYRTLRSVRPQVTVEDDFVLVIAVYISHIAQDMMIAPLSSADDATIHLFMIRAPISRLRLVRLYAAMMDGTAAADPAVETARVSAFRLEPLDERQGGVLMVDGEMVDYGPIQAQVLPSLARVMTLTKR